MSKCYKDIWTIQLKTQDRRPELLLNQNFSGANIKNIEAFIFCSHCPLSYIILIFRSFADEELLVSNLYKAL